jgi:5-methyltetrahydropteroyltriglutamate--homocysteine methyltransferase
VTEIACYVHGAFPRSEALVAATRDADRSRRSAVPVDEQRALDRAGFLALQAETGLDYRSVGWFGWADLFRPLVAATAGLATGPLTRWFDTNTFFRAPVLTGPDLVLDRAAFATAAGLTAAGQTAGPDTEASQVAMLPGPYTFSRLAEPDADRDALMPRLARDVLRPAAEELRAAGAELLQLQEPALVTRPVAAGSWPHLAEAVRIIAGDLSCRVVVHTYYGDAGPVLDRLRELPVDAVGIDLTETDLESLRGTWRTGLLAGCLDGRSSRLEDVDATATLVGRIVETAQPPLLLLSSAGDLELVPRTVAEDKVRVLGAATRRLREELAC